jgi:hypothetical protein
LAVIEQDSEQRRHISAQRIIIGLPLMLSHILAHIMRYGTLRMRPWISLNNGEVLLVEARGVAVESRVTNKQVIEN